MQPFLAELWDIAILGLVVAVVSVLCKAPGLKPFIFLLQGSAIQGAFFYVRKLIDLLMLLENC